MVNSFFFLTVTKSVLTENSVILRKSGFPLPPSEAGPCSPAFNPIPSPCLHPGAPACTPCGQAAGAQTETPPRRSTALGWLAAIL